MKTRMSNRNLSPSLFSLKLSLIVGMTINVSLWAEDDFKDLVSQYPDITQSEFDDGLETEDLSGIGPKDLEGIAADYSAIVKKYIKKKVKNGYFSGSVIAAREGQVVYHKAHNRKRAKHKVKLNTRFRAASVTKSFTALAILELVEQGVIGLHDSVTDHVPSYPYPEVTIAQLLSHTSGMPDWGNTDRRDLKFFDVIRGFIQFGKRVPQPASTGQLVQELSRYPLMFSPDTDHSYSNAGYALLAAVIENHSGQHVFDYLQEKILNRLGMNDSGFWWEEARGRKAKGYLNAGPVIIKTPIQSHSTHAHAGGALYTTAGDMWKFGQALIESQIISRSMQNQMFTERANAPGTAKYFGAPGLKYYGYGVYLGEVDGLKLVAHSGTIPGYSSVYYYVPDKKIFVVVLHNILHATTDRSPRKIGYGIVKRLLKPLP